MRYLFLTDTPVQVLNSLLYIYGNKIASQSDIFIVNQFKDAQKLSKRLRDSKHFNKVVLINKSKDTIFKHFLTIFSLVFPRLYLSSILKINIKSSCYDSVFLSVSTKIFDAIVAATKCKNIIGIDDGIGSYFRDTFMGLATRKYRFVRKLFGREYHIKKLFLNSPEFYIGIGVNSLEKLCPLQQLDADNQRAIDNVFNYEETDIYKLNKFVYLNQPTVDFSAKYLETEFNIIEKLYEISRENIVVRLHPRESKKHLYERFKIDDVGNLWELVVTKELSENHVLIGMFSTAQFVPKFMYDKEPTVIFTFNLHDDIGDDLKNGFVNMVNVLRDSYKNKDKIVVLNSVEDLSTIL